MGTELQPMDATSLLEVIGRAASDPSVDIEKMERLINLHERIVGKQAESAFNIAMTAAQSEMGPVSTDAENKQTHSRYATYGKLDSALRPIYTKHGFALSFDTGVDAAEGFLRVVCHVSHRDGHSRRYHVDMPADGKGAKGGDVMTKTHATGAAASYGMRYLLKMIFNVAIGEDDRDGNPPEAKQKQKRQDSGNEIFDLAISALKVERDVSRIDALCERFRQRFSEGKVTAQHVLEVAEAAGRQEASILEAKADYAQSLVAQSILTRSGYDGDVGKVLSAAKKKPKAKMIEHVRGEAGSWLQQ